MQKKKPTKVEPETIPEVVDFIDADAALREFKEEHGELFEQLALLSERRNAALEQAEKVCRAREVSCGPFNLYQFAVKYDATALFDLVGRTKFLELGGSINSVPEYTIDKGRLEAVIAQGKLPDDVVKAVRKETPNFHKPEKLVLP